MQTASTDRSSQQAAAGQQRQATWFGNCGDVVELEAGHAKIAEKIPLRVVQNPELRDVLQGFLDIDPGEVDEIGFGDWERERMPLPITGNRLAGPGHVGIATAAW